MAIQFRRAHENDAGHVLSMIYHFYEEFDYEYDENIMRDAMMRLLLDENIGEMYLIEKEQQQIGYAVLTFGFSLEYGGRDAFIDEIFLKPPNRGQGIGREAVRFLLERARVLNIRALHLEVENENRRALKMYEDQGFKSNKRSLLTHRIANQP